MNPAQLRAAVAALHAGQVIAYPTEAVWGLGCDPENQLACERIFALKQRDWRKGLILVGSDFAQFEPYIRMPSNSALKRATATWPGPHTWIFPCADDAPMWLTGERDDIALRVSAHPVVRALCERFGGALVSTSANRSGREPARSATQLRLQFGPLTPRVVPGAVGGMVKPTPIRNVITGAIIRA
ncbi:MAG TPA: Sua5/YciO/YrdC/YwlC family protein [Nevskiaceae bacterium]|nr:Sua5/YciO/YrdC/YwlC family protein [Nevskiaceae bacterium]